MTWDDLSKILVGLLAVAAAGLQLARTREGGRAAIKHDLEILNGLEPASAAHAAMRQHVEARVVVLVRHEQGARRDGLGITAAIFMLAFAVLLGVIAWGAEGIWPWLIWPSVVIFGVGTIAGAVEAVPRRQRGAKGKPVTSDADAP